MRPERLAVDIIIKVIAIGFLAYVFIFAAGYLDKGAKGVNKGQLIIDRYEEVQKKHMRLEPPADLRQRIESHLK